MVVVDNCVVISFQNQLGARAKAEGVLEHLEVGFINHK